MLNKAVQEHYENSKFVVLVFDDNYEILQTMNDLKNESIIFISIEDLIGTNKYGTLADGHPNAETWDLIVPKLVEYLADYDKNKSNNEEEFENKYGEYNYEVETTASDFSICNFDRQLIERKEISSLRASFAYISFCIGHFLESIKLNFIANVFKKTAVKLNPKNRIYEEHAN